MKINLTGVPFTTVDTCEAVFPFSSGNGASFEMPKSDTLALYLESSNMLVALISRWIIGGSASV